MGITSGIEAGGFTHLVAEYVKRLAYRSRALNFLSRPRYVYNIGPAQITWLCDAISQTKGNGGCIIEVGAARGMTTLFLLTHMAEMGDKRPFVVIDTFSGFTKEDVSYEVKQRNKNRSAYRSFRYNDREIFMANLAKAGFPDVVVFETDVSTFDFSGLPSIDVMLIDVDLYLPTLATLERSQRFWSAPAFIMVDDVTGGTPYDGAGAAYTVFLDRNGLQPEVIGTKGGVITYSM